MEPEQAVGISVQLVTDPAEYDLESAPGRWMVMHGYYWGLFAYPILGGRTADGEQPFDGWYWRLSRN